MKSTVTVDDFVKLDLRVGQVIAVNDLPESKHLLELLVDFGPEIGKRTVYSGIKTWYSPDQLLGRKFAFIINLVPRTFKIGGKEFVSNGMIIAADDGSRAILYTFDQDLPVGAILR